MRTGCVQPGEEKDKSGSNCSLIEKVKPDSPQGGTVRG